MGNTRREELLSKIRIWHKRDEHGKIIEEIDKIPREFWDYEVTCLYTRALNNCALFEDALNILMDVRVLGEHDPVWNFRIGYSLYGLGREEEAIDYIKMAIGLGDNTEDAWLLLNVCLDEVEQKIINKTKNKTRSKNKDRTAKRHSKSYSMKDFQALKRHIEKYFGAFKSVFHEASSENFPVDIAVIEPTLERNYYTLVTLGMGARKMNTPPDLEEFRLQRAEIMICLPPDWNLDDTSDENWYWPLRWLNILARLPREKNTWLGWGHTIPNDSPLAENTRLSAVMLIYPGAFGKQSFGCALPSGGEVNFYQMIPLYPKELEYKLRHNAEALLNLMNDDDLEYVKLNRKIVTGQ
jgi:tetratricopeptide (TPR) repeat protein